MTVDEINTLIHKMNDEKGKISDGFHSFDELYEFRKVLNACLFNEWYKQGKNNVHKSIKHSNGELCFGGGWFIVVAQLDCGQISFHYEMKDWDCFKIPDKEIPNTFDLHNSNDVLVRLLVESSK